MEAKIAYTQMLKNSIRKAFSDSPYLDMFLSYRVKYNVRKSRSCGAVYYLESKIMYVNLDSINKEDLLLSVMIHEASHHIEFMQEGYTKHDKMFRYIQEKVLNAAFELGYIDPYRLIIYYQYLSAYTERNKVTKMCRSYINRCSAKKEFFMFLKFSYNKDLISYLKSNSFTYIMLGPVRGWYKFYDDESAYLKEKGIYDKAIRTRPSLQLDYIYSGQIS